MVNQKVLRPDFIFSYWIFIWYVLFILKIVKQNPFYILCFALLINSFDMIIKIYLNYPKNVILSFIIINIFLKVLPIIHLMSITDKKFDIVALIYVFIVYMIWLWINKMVGNATLFVEAEKRTYIPPFEHLFTTLF